MSRIDLKKQLKPLYQTTARTVVEIDVPPLQYLMIDGHGDPNTSSDFAAATEGATIARLHEHIAACGSLRGKHHEIYLSDIRKADPSRWKTLIRQPMAVGPPSPAPQRHKGG